MVNIKTSTIHQHGGGDSKHLFFLLKSVINKDYDYVLKQDIMYLNQLMRRGLKNKITIKELKHRCASTFKGQIYNIDSSRFNFIHHYFQPTLVADTSQPYNFESGKDNIVDALIAVFLKLNKSLCPNMKDNIKTIMKTKQISMRAMGARSRYVTLEDVLFDTQVKNIFLLTRLNKFFKGMTSLINISQLLLMLPQDGGAFYKMQFLHQEGAINNVDVVGVLNSMRNNQVLASEFQKIIQKDQSVFSYFVNCCGAAAQRILYDAFESHAFATSFYQSFAHVLATSTSKNYVHYHDRIGSEPLSRNNPGIGTKNLIIDDVDVLDDDIEGMLRGYYEIVFNMIQRASPTELHSTLKNVCTIISFMQAYTLKQDGAWYEIAYVIVMKIYKIVHKNLFIQHKLPTECDIVSQCEKFAIMLFEKRKDIVKRHRVLKRMLQHFEFYFVEFVYFQGLIDDSIALCTIEKLISQQKVYAGPLCGQMVKNIIVMTRKVFASVSTPPHKNRIFHIIQHLHPTIKDCIKAQQFCPMVERDLQDIYSRLLAHVDNDAGDLTNDEHAIVLRQIIEVGIYNYQSLRQILSTIKHDILADRPFSYFDIQEQQFQQAYLQYITLRQRVWRRNSHRDMTDADMDNIEQENVNVINQIIYTQFTHIEDVIIQTLQQLFYQNLDNLALIMQGFSSGDNVAFKARMVSALFGYNSSDTMTYIRLYLIVRAMTNDDEDLYEDGRLRDEDLMQNLFLVHEKINHVLSINSARATTITKVDSFIFRLILYYHKSAKSAASICPQQHSFIQYYPENALKNMMKHYVENKQQNVTLKKTLLDIEYEQPLASLVDVLLYKSQVTIVDGLGADYSVLFYTIVEGNKINHDGIDQEGLLKHLVQSCMDQINVMKLFEEDEDGFLFIRKDCDDVWDNMQDEENVTQDEANRLYFGIGVFLVFLLTQEHKVPFRLKDEILYYLCADEELIPYEDFYFDYDSHTSIALSKINEKDIEYDDLIAMAKEQHKAKYYLGVQPHGGDIKSSKSQHKLWHMRQGFQYFKKTFSLYSLCYQEVKRKFNNVPARLNHDDVKKRLRYSFNGKASDVTILEEQNNSVESDQNAITDIHTGITAAAIRLNYERVKDLFVQTLDSFSQTQLEQFVKLACGTLYSQKKITVQYVHKNILPTWTTCYDKLTIGRTFTKEQLLLSLEHAGEGFYLV